MDYSQEQLDRIEELAKQLTPVLEIGILLGLPNEDELQLDISTVGHPARKRFLHGLALTANELRRKNMELANACAPSAMEQCFHDLKQMLIDIE